MDGEIKELKTRLRALVVSSPAQVDVRTLLRDYLEFVGEPIPISRFGYNDPVEFLRSRCHDCFLFEGPSTNPRLILIVPDTLVHIDHLVQNQKETAKVRLYGKRRSIPISVVNTLRQHLRTYILPRARSVPVSGNMILNDCPAILANHMPNPTGRTLNAEINGQATNQAGFPNDIRMNRELHHLELSLTRLGYIRVHVAAGARFSVSVTVEGDNDADDNANDNTNDNVNDDANDDANDNANDDANDDRAMVRSRTANPPPDGAYSLEWNSAAVSQHDDDDDDIDTLVYPPDCFIFVEKISSLKLNDLNVGDQLHVNVTAVFSPENFWFIRIGANNRAMGDMIDRMTEYYSVGDGWNLVLSPEAVELGYNCASLYDNYWHRSVIVKILDRNTVKVQHLDYGTMTTENVSTLKPLLRGFASLPAQAEHARLEGIRPVEGPFWSRDATEYLKRRVLNASFIGYIAARDLRNQVAVMSLFDTSDGKAIDIGDELLELGYADFRINNY